MFEKPIPWKAGLFLLLAGALFLWIGIPASLPVQAAPGSVGQVGSSGVISQQQGAKATSYWTSVRMRSALPADLQSQGAVSRRPLQSLTPSGKPEAVAPVAPHAGHLSQSITARNASSEPRRYSYPFPFKRKEVSADYTQWPYSAEGKIFFTDSRTNHNYVCSGTSVNSANKSVVDTAGHCVIEGGSGNNWYTNWIFCPAYRDGNCPLGQWTAKQLWSYSFWYQNGWFEYDLGEAVVNTNNGQTLTDKVGGEGLAWNFPREQNFVALGYPAAAPFNGNRMFECDAPYATDDTPSNQHAKPDLPAVGIGCDMTGGSSGGPWYINFSSNGGNRNAHNDYKYDEAQPLAMYSPYYGNEEKAVYDAAQHS